MSTLCLSCSSTLRSPDTHRTPCCSAPICAACIARNPRILEWVPCLRCGDGVQAVAAPTRLQEDTFVLGGDDEDGPPGYEEIVSVHGTADGTASDRATGFPPATEDRSSTPQEPLTHRIQPGETIRSISTRYAMDPYAVAKLNDLPYTAITTHPTLIHTRKYLILARSDLRSAQAPEGITRWDGVVDDEQRTKERLAKRFQLLTKTPDPLIAKTYLALTSQGETIFSFPASSDDEGPDTEREKEKPRTPVQMVGEEAAVALYFDDEEWEAAQASRLETGSKGQGHGTKWFSSAGGKDKVKGKGKWVSRPPGGVGVSVGVGGQKLKEG